MNGIARRLAACALAGAALAQEQPTMDEQQRSGFFARTVVVGGEERRYTLFVPRAHVPQQRWPLVVFLNGRGECGTDGTKPTTVGLGPAIRADEARWPFLVAFPQKPDRDSQWSEHGGLVLGVVRDVEATYYIDPKRRFLTGISQGGAGTWALGARHADLFAAIAPVCGYGRPDEVAASLKRTPIWAFHGEDDAVVPARQSKALCAAVEAAGGSPVLTLYPNTAHNSWDQAYRDSGLAEWLRTVVAEPVLARHLADPASITRMGLEVWRYERGQQPPGIATERVEVEVDGARLGIWHSVSHDLESSEDRGFTRSASHAETWQQAHPDETRRLLLVPVRALQRAGLFDAPEPDPGQALAGPRLRVRITLRGEHGQCTFDADARDDPDAPSAVATVLRDVITIATASIPEAGK